MDQAVLYPFSKKASLLRCIAGIPEVYLELLFSLYSFRRNRTYTFLGNEVPYHLMSSQHMNTLTILV
ncbi:hypothetical protein OUZ56_018465 [Daphnia magna]|uniref:Uncharacterized protein n=1 Tax=Daphnia magna TaxID=35525 RepID=A0ABQ9Z922_9CRUS|nr:hypothetical protein OUZ56_018465 [Daphnia magna]